MSTAILKDLAEAAPTRTFQEIKRETADLETSSGLRGGTENREENLTHIGHFIMTNPRASLPFDNCPIWIGKGFPISSASASSGAKQEMGGNDGHFQGVFPLQAFDRVVALGQPGFQWQSC